MSDGNSFDDKLNFGKYKGKTIREVLRTDPGWLCWIRDEVLSTKRQAFLADDVSADLDVWLSTLEGLRRSKGKFRNWTANPPDFAAMNREVSLIIEEAAVATEAVMAQAQAVSFAGYGDEWGAF